MRPNKVLAINGLSAAVDQVSGAIPTDFVVNASVQVVTTGTSTGTLKIQMSNDIGPPVGTLGQPAPTNWSDIASITVSVTAAGAVNIPKFDTCYGYIRAVWTHTNAASGTLSVTIKTNGF